MVGVQRSTVSCLRGSPQLCWALGVLFTGFQILMGIWMGGPIFRAICFQHSSVKRRNCSSNGLQCKARAGPWLEACGQLQAWRETPEAGAEVPEASTVTQGLMARRGVPVIWQFYQSPQPFFFLQELFQVGHFTSNSLNELNYISTFFMFWCPQKRCH